MSQMLTKSLSQYLASAEELIAEARAGRMFILVDDEDRENEGDLVIPAQFATPDAVNFMARHARGLICLSMTRPRVEQLGLPLMSQSNGTRHSTAFTVSIEARDGVTTGISAHDRAHTIAVAINPERGPIDIVTPGHVFPLVAREGGTLVRAGQTEAAVEIARLEVGVLGGTATDAEPLMSLVRELGDIGRGPAAGRLDPDSARILSRLIADLDRMILKVERELRSMRQEEAGHAVSAAAQLAYAKNAAR
jgi:3,4-dihydroxy-2-butanone 4-phosphate synthase